MCGAEPHLSPIHLCVRNFLWVPSLIDFISIFQFCMMLNNERKEDNEVEDGASTGSSSIGEDEALAEMLGVSSLNCVADQILVEDEDVDHPNSFVGIPCFRTLLINNSCQLETARKMYKSKSVYKFPKQFSISPDLMRRITLELTFASDKYYSDKTFETILSTKKLTRMENFVMSHPIWKDLCYGYLQELVSFFLEEEYVLYKEKLNLKPPGGSGFAPHLDTPSLRAAFIHNEHAGPRDFITIMIAVDAMTTQNGCLRVIEGPWSEKNHIEVLQPMVVDANPDSNGRAGAIPDHVSCELQFKDVICDGGDIFLFSGWTPHRSSSNPTHFSRRAVFLTYNPRREGDFRNEYYQRMQKLRDDYKIRNTIKQHQFQADYQMDLEAMETVPKI